MTISKDRVKPSPLPDSWKLAEIFTTGIVLGSYLAMMTVIFFWAAYKTNFFPVRTLPANHYFFILISEAININRLKYDIFYKFLMLQCVMLLATCNLIS